MRTHRWMLLATASAALAFGALLEIHPGALPISSIDNATQLVVALVAAAAAGRRARLRSGRIRVSWALIALGSLGWASGQGLWCYYELVIGRATPFPSIADAGYLLFPVSAAAAMLVRPSHALAGRARARAALDVVLVVVSLFTVSWATVFGEVFRAGADSVFARAVSLAYPAADVAVLTVVVLVLSYARAGDRAGLAWLGVSLASVAIADSGFAYLTASGQYHTGNLIDAGWVAGFLTLTFAAASDSPRDPDGRPDSPIPTGALLLPYLPALVGVVVALSRLGAASGDAVTLVAAAVMVTALVLRQAVVLLENRSLMSRISHQALHDVLTGLANRALFADRLAHALELHQRDLRSVSVILIDLDDFKTVNDTLGHPTGDELLVRVSERLRAAVRRGDTIARLGGDEFAIVIEDGGDPFEVAERILGSLENSVVIGPHAIPVGLSIGIAQVAPADGPVTPSEVLHRADLAMYAAKRSGKRSVRVYSDDMIMSGVADLDRLAALVADVSLGRIEVAYQPIYRADGSLHGYESLARWAYDGKPVSPGVFLPMAHELGCATRVDEAVLARTVRDAATWPDNLVATVNLDGLTLADPMFADRLAKILTVAGLAPGRLVVEVLESNLIEHDKPAMATLARLRSLGVGIAVDDFGAGYASLARLYALQPDVVKIDRSLIHVQQGRLDGAALLRGITELARQLGATVIAEGIESQNDLSTAIAAGCDAMQGYLLGRPVLAARIAASSELSKALPAPAS